ncbi:single-stranded DNA-binding protein [Methylomonas sp. EFPC1]|uniref:single-stranded DNA-binding protein n=1 Tax=Methylomonas sp. EFPC1 TaxID=2812647 RepID=UPI001967D869|nr:single-stranded DNA-binding protein [Methylomonas sp. EFPC1]QSB03441.1 single-stranded DNA-binding protein [Methylomonas sp. EFPC1]
MLNKVQLIGRLGGDPDVRYLPDGTATATINLATTRRWKDRNTQERKEETEWHRVVFFSGLADIAKQYLAKGAQIYVEGRLKTRKWQGHDNQERYTTEIIANDMKMLSGKKDSPAQNPNIPPTAADDFDDEIPF